MKKITILLFAFFACAILAYSQDYKQKSLNVTVYNNDLGVIRDIREIKINSGISEIKITDVASLIEPSTVHIKLNGNVLEQNFQYDLVNLEKVLSKYIDKNIQLVSDNTVISGVLLSVTGNQIVLKQNDGGLLMLPKYDTYRVSVGSLPEGLITKPTLVWKLESPKTANQDVELSYQTRGMNWHAEYVAVLDEKDTKISLNSWVSIDNNSGTTFKDAKIKLVAGNVNRIVDNIKFSLANRMLGDGMEVDAAPKAQFEERSFFEYHIYDLQRNTNLANNETKQISLFQADNISINKKYRYNSYDWNNGKTKVEVIIEFENKKLNNLGMPIPAGKVALYKTDGNSLEFIGEDKIEHTPKDEKIKLKVGEAFDIIAEEKQTNTKKISDKIWEYTYEISIRNRKDENIVIDIEKYLGYNWEIIENNFDFEKIDAQKVLFKIPIKKNEEKILKLKVRM